LGPERGAGAMKPWWWIALVPGAVIWLAVLSGCEPDDAEG